MSNSVTVFAAAIALSAITFASAHAGPYTAGMSGLQKSLQPADAQAQIVHKTGKKRKFVTGLIIGFGAAAAIGYSIRHERRCRRWRRWCWNGNDNACWKFDNRC